MISQADILKTLANKNCTDQTVMATALSPDCTLPKLLEKLTEAERFDLALDLSMKLGLDVIPLWKTWAMRCLRHRNFVGAREKFRHCFQRARLPSGRSNPMLNQLLTSILNELIGMDEEKLSLVEELELIQHRKGPYSNEPRSTSEGASKDSQDNILNRPKIYAECMHYLNAYGTIQDHISFNVRNSLWTAAVKLLIQDSNRINIEKFFIGEVIQYALTTGCLNKLIDAFLESDQQLSLSTKYFEAIYSFCERNSRYNLLYYVQVSIGDYVAAAQTRIHHFFLKKPLNNYKELNERMSFLVDARKNYQDHLDRLKRMGATSVHTSSEDKHHKSKSSSQLFSEMPIHKAETQIKVLDLQIEITRNFAMNEVSGCINGIELETIAPEVFADSEQIEKMERETDDMPVTLFEKSNGRKIFLAALVLIYFDLSCTTYFSKNGLDLAKCLIEEQGLDKLNVFKTAMRIIMRDDSCDIVENASLLLARIKDWLADQSHQVKKLQIGGVQVRSHANPIQDQSNLRISSSNIKDDSTVSKTNITLGAKNEESQTMPKDDFRVICDEVIRDAILCCPEPDYKMELAKLLSGEARVELYIKHGKLSNAQRLACNMNRADYVSNIIKEADRLNQNHVKTVCQLWLAKHETTRNFIL